jgi:hypothetical protein
MYQSNTSSNPSHNPSVTSLHHPKKNDWQSRIQGYFQDEPPASKKNHSKPTPTTTNPSTRPFHSWENLLQKINLTDLTPTGSPTGTTPKTLTKSPQSNWLALKDTAVNHQQLEAKIFEKFLIKELVKSQSE